jgi:hypothetical protein
MRDSTVSDLVEDRRAGGEVQPLWPSAGMTNSEPQRDQQTMKSDGDSAREPLAHSKSIERLVKAGQHAEARAVHNAHVASELHRAEAGETINLSDLLAGKEPFESGL